MEDQENRGATVSARKTRRGLSVRKEPIAENAPVDASSTPVAKAAGKGAGSSGGGAPIAMECDFLESYLKPMAFFLMNDLDEAQQWYVRAARSRIRLPPPPFPPLSFSCSHNGYPAF